MKKGLLILGLTAGITGQTAYDAIRLFTQETGTGGRALALGQAYQALSGDLSGLYWNPAGLGQVNKPVFTLNMRQSRLQNQARYQDETTPFRLHGTGLSTLGLLYPVPVRQGALTLGLAYNTVGQALDGLRFSGFSTVPNAIVFHTGDETTSAFDRNVYREMAWEQKGGPATLTAGMALAFSPTTLVGVSISRRFGGDQYHYTFRQRDTDEYYVQYPEDYAAYAVERFVHTTYTAWEVKLGALLTLGRHFRLGLTLAPPFTYQVREVYTAEEILTYDNGDVEGVRPSDPGQWNYAVSGPYRAGVGLAFTSRRLILSADLAYADFSQTRFIFGSILDENSLALVQENARLQATYSERFTARVGGEWILWPKRLALQAGWQEQSALTEADRTRRRLSGGVTWSFDRQADIQFSLSRELFTRQSADEFTPAVTVEHLRRWGLIMGLNYRI